jgi:hypothetical protein
MSPRWALNAPFGVLGARGWSARFPVGYGLTGSNGRRPGTRDSGSGEEHSGRSGGGAAPGGIGGATALPLPTCRARCPSSSAEGCEHSQHPNGSAPSATRQRVVLLPHAQIEPPDTRPTTTAPDPSQA